MGDFLFEKALAHPNVGFVGCEVFENGVASLLAKIIKFRISNIRIHFGNCLDLIHNFNCLTLNKIYILFPDPWPKTRHAKRRIFSPSMLNKLAFCLKPGGSLRFASDHPVAKSWLLAEVLRNSAFTWTAQSAKDWRLRPPNWPQSRYMVKGEHEGRASSWFDFKRN